MRNKTCYSIPDQIQRTCGKRTSSEGKSYASTGRKKKLYLTLTLSLFLFFSLFLNEINFGAKIILTKRKKSAEQKF